MHPFRSIAGVAAVAFVGVSPALAAEPIPTVLNQAVNAGMKVVKSFPAASGLTGWVLSQGGRYSVVYTTADRKTLVAGALIDERGQNLSEVYEDKFVPKPDFAAAYKRLEQAAYVAEGPAQGAKNVIYVFVDPNCPFCNMAWRALQPYEAAGLQVRWIPVATLGPTSLPKALEVLAASDKAAAFRRMELNHGKPWTAPAGISESSHPAVVAQIRENGELMAQFGIGGTPGIVWRDKQGNVRVKSGMPRLSELPALTGLPEQKITDAALERFR
jgi:thiol:disulfide interchange protein DsbG